MLVFVIPKSNDSIQEDKKSENDKMKLLISKHQKNKTVIVQYS